MVDFLQCIPCTRGLTLANCGNPAWLTVIGLGVGMGSNEKRSVGGFLRKFSWKKGREGLSSFLE
jgi:hypothetical protein